MLYVLPSGVGRRKAVQHKPASLELLWYPEANVKGTEGSVNQSVLGWVGDMRLSLLEL